MAEQPGQTRTRHDWAMYAQRQEARAEAAEASEQQARDELVRVLTEGLAIETRAERLEAALSVMLDFADEIAGIPVDSLGKYAVAANLQEAAHRSRAAAKGTDLDDR